MAHNDDESFRLNRRSIRAAFDRASASYDAAAVLQTQVRTELLDRLELLKVEPQVVLDLGAGTGQATRHLKRRYRRATVVAMDIAPGMLVQARKQTRLFSRFERVCGDVMRLPFAQASADLIFSSLMLQWCDDLDGALAEIRRVLKPGGFFGFTTFGPDTLRELRTAWSAADSYNHVSRFLDMHDIGDALSRAGFSEPVLDVERVQLTYADTRGLMQDLKAIGARNATEGRAKGLTGKSRLLRMNEAYESFRKDGRLPATYEVVYGAAWGPAGRPATSVIAGEARVPVGSIRRRGA